jgi:hypothetical protein
MTTIYETDDGLEINLNRLDDMKLHVEDLADRCDRRADEVRGTKSAVTALEWTDLADRLRGAVE